MGSISNWFFGTQEVIEERHGSEGSAGGTSPLPGIVPPERPTLDVITPETALTIGTVYRSVDLITTSVSQMELGVYRNGIELPAPGLIKTPNVNEPASAFVQETVWSLATYGNAYWRLYGSPAASLEVLPPEAVTITRHERTGEKQYWYGQENLTGKVKHLKLQRIPGRDYGVGPIQMAKGELQAAFLLKRFSEAWFDVSGVPTGVLTTDQTLNSTQAAAFAAAWKDFLATHGGTAVLSQGMTYQPLNIKPAEAQYLDVARENNLNIARLFGIPSMHLAVEMGGTSMTYMNLEQTNILFIQNTLVRYMNEIENNLSDLLPRGQRVQFKEEGLLRSDTVTKWNVLKTQADIGYTNGNELRAAEGKAPLPVATKPEAENPVGGTADGTSRD